MKKEMKPVIPVPFNENGEKYVNGLKIDKNPVAELKKIFSNKYHSQVINLRRYGKYFIYGCAYNYRPYLKKYVFKQYSDWFECYAPNKTFLRKTTFGKIDKILEIK